MFTIVYIDGFTFTSFFTMEKKVIKAVIFDLDGTVLDSIPLYQEAQETVCRDKFTLEFKSEINGRLDTEVAVIMANKYKHFKSPEDYIAQRDEILIELLKHCPLVKGVDRIIKRLYKMEIPMAIGTSTPKDAYELKIAPHADFFKKYFKVSVTGSEVKNGKPNPEVFQTASKKLGDFKPENVLVFEDAYLGCLAAQNAGMSAVMRNADGFDTEADFKKYNLTNTKALDFWDQFNFDDYVFEK